VESRREGRIGEGSGDGIILIFYDVRNGEKNQGQNWGKKKIQFGARGKPSPESLLGKNSFNDINGGSSGRRMNRTVGQKMDRAKWAAIRLNRGHSRGDHSLWVREGSETSL